MPDLRVSAQLTGEQVRRLRMHALLLAGPSGSAGLPALGPTARTPADIVTWFGAMQAQDLGSGKWSLGVRIPGATSADIDAAIESGAVLRTWPMRGTVHLVPPADAAWMLALLSAKPLAGAAARRAYLGLTEDQVEVGADVLSRALAGGRRATRSECVELLREAGIHTAGQHAYHLLWYVSQIGVTCMGPNQGSEATFVRLDEWVARSHGRAPDPPDRETGLGIMALRFIRSHGPVTAADLARWLGLGVREARTGIAAAGQAVCPVSCEGRAMYATPELLAHADAATEPPSEGPAVLALPGFDEFMLGYKDRELMLDPAHFQAIVPGGNGVFQPTLVHDGRVVGTWRRTTRPKRVELRPRTFAGTPGPRTRLRRGVELALTAYADYLGLPADVRWESS